ncbi:MAG: hypothetical protein Q7T76_07615 [Ferruginibacter sp.]|nr:hypothetical protein [Ferruginibacter sp.]
MNELIEYTINAHGGLDQWRKFYTLSAHLAVGGVLWAMKGHAGAIDEIDVTVNLLEQKTSHIPGEAWHTAYTPNRVAIEAGNGSVVEELYNPRQSFKDHTLETTWSNLQLAYFTGYAMWNYLNTPFLFARPGFEIREEEPWEEGNETWRRLRIKWPNDIHTHSEEQVLYIDKQGLIRRQDYKVEISGNVPAAHYLSAYKEISGIKIATKREVFSIGENNMPQPGGPLIVSIELSEIKFR